MFFRVYLPAKTGGGDAIARVRHGRKKKKKPKANNQPTGVEEHAKREGEEEAEGERRNDNDQRQHLPQRQGQPAARRSRPGVAKIDSRRVKDGMGGKASGTTTGYRGAAGGARRGRKQIDTAASLRRPGRVNQKRARQRRHRRVHTERRQPRDTPARCARP